MWVVYGSLALIAYLLFRIWRELHYFAFITAFNLTMVREIAFNKVLSGEEKERYEEMLESTKQKHPKYFRG